MTPSDDRQARIAQLVKAHLRGALDGSDADEHQLIAAHGDLLPELEQELQKARVVQAAYAQVASANVTNPVDGTAGVGKSTAYGTLRIRCPHCHGINELDSDESLEGLLCSGCGSQFSVLGERDDLVSRPRFIAHFLLLERLGGGGFGTVWKARDTQLDRLVAVKLPHRSRLAAEESELFFREARAAAQLRHPGIVSVFEVGRADESIYIVSELIEGISLADWLKDGRMSAAEAGELCRELAAALVHAHARGVIHRDLKPANIILDADLRPHLTDFGLARRELGEMTMTVDGQLVGTPAYMSPEQARGDSHKTDARSDVYALGVILFELLTGTLPFRGQSSLLLEKITLDEPPRPRQLRATVPRDLETITLKCLEKEAERRYSTAAELHDDLQRFLRREPILARPVGRLARAWRWCKRRPAVAALGSFATALVVTLAVAATLVAWRESQRRREAVVQQRLLRHQVYTLDMDAAMRAWQEAIVPRVAEILDRWKPAAGREDLRGFEWYYLWRNCQRGDKCPTYRHAPRDVDHLAFTVDGRYVAVLEGSTYVLLDAANATPMRHEKLSTTVTTATALSPDGSLAATSGPPDAQTAVRLWRLLPNRSEVALEGPIPEVQALLFSPDSAWLAGASADHTVRFWETSTGKQAARLDAATIDDAGFAHSELQIMAVSQDHRLLATVFDRTRPVLWDVPNQRMLRELAGHGDIANSAAFSPDGALLATGGQDNLVKLWDVASGRLVRTLTGHHDWIMQVAFTRDGKTIGSCSQDNTVRLWRVPNGEEVETLKGHEDNIGTFAFGPDSGQLVTDGYMERVTKLWRLKETDRSEILPGRASAVMSVALAPDERTIAGGDGEGEIRIWDAHRGELVRVLANLGHTVDFLAFSPGGEWLAACSKDAITVWAADTWQIATRINCPEAEPSMVAFTNDGRSMISVSSDGKICYRDVGSFQPLSEFDSGDVAGRAVAISPDDKLLATGYKSGSIKLWDLATSQIVGTIPRQPRPIFHVSFSPDGKLLASAADEGEIRLWDVATRQAYGQPMKHLATVLRAKFLPDGKTLASCSADHTIGLWDVETCTQRGVLRGTGGWVRDLDVSRSGRLLVSGGGDEKIRLWRAASPPEVAAAEGNRQSP